MTHGPTVLIWNRILLGIDNSIKSLSAVNFVAAVLGGSSNCQIKIVSVHQPPTHDNFPDQGSRTKEDLRRREEITTVLIEARSLLLDAGIPEGNISWELIESTGISVGEALVEHQQRYGFGTVVVGRRGLTKAEEFLYGSVSAQVVHLARDCAVWVVS